MKILCIDDISLFGGKHPHLDYGEVYEATGEAKSLTGDDCYIIPDLPVSISGNRRKNKGPLYRKCRFIPLSDIDETTLVNEKEATA